MKIKNNNEPIFIHSIFRASSTYIFKKFRENDELYTSYQEPVHEIGIMALNDHEVLNKDTGNEKNDLLRHPVLKKSYFYELYNIADKVLPNLNENDIYNNYFDENVDSLCSYLFSIAENSANRCVIQECRLTARMFAIKEKMGGIHLYLWRNPWDQWWSYKVTDYFDTANLLISSANKVPSVIQSVAEKINVPKYHNDDVLEKFAHYLEIKLSAENSYYLFYSIWLLSLIEASENSDYFFSIDKLSTSDDYKKLVSDELLNRGIQGIDFSDCEVPQAIFSKKDIDFFTAIESSVHNMFLKSGYESKQLEKVLSLREEYSPHKLRKNEKSSATQILKDSERARELTRKYMTDLSLLQHKFESVNTNNKNLILQSEHAMHKAIAKARKLEAKANRVEAKASNAEVRLKEIEARTNEAGARANEAEVRANEAEARANEAGARANEAEKKLNEANARITALLQSSSWRISQPFRSIMRLVIFISSKSKLLCVKVVRRLIRIPISFIIKHPRLKATVLKMIRKSTFLDKFTRVMYLRDNEVSSAEEPTILTDRGNEILNEIKRAKKL